MTEERDEKVTQRYRELGAEEPPRALDAAILAAARRGTGSRPASLDRANRQRWYGPLAAAAVIVLAVAVTLHLQLEQPEVDGIGPQSKARSPTLAKSKVEEKAEPQPPPQANAAERRAPAVDQARRAEAPKTFVPDPAPAPVEEPAPAQAPAAPAPAAAGGVAARSAPLAERDDLRRERMDRPAAAQLSAKTAKSAEEAETPERELERIAELRRQGKHDEADKALAEFRKRFPDYRIPEPMLERVERR